MWTQLVNPKLDTVDGVGWCLRFTQTVWGAPARYESAWDAWQATQHKHPTSEPLPNNVGVIVWFEHYGDYDNNGKTENWGHVVSWIPGRGFLSSPTTAHGPVGQTWCASIGEVERTFNSVYKGWSEDINGRIVASYTDNPQPTEDEEMAIVYLHKDANPVKVGSQTSKDGDQWLAMPGVFQHIDSGARKQILESKIPGLRTLTVNSLELQNLYSAFMGVGNA